MKLSDIKKMEKLAFAKLTEGRVGQDLKDIKLERYRALNGKIYQLDELHKQYQEQLPESTKFGPWTKCESE
jgi:hypothetical protein